MTIRRLAASAACLAGLFVIMAAPAEAARTPDRHLYANDDPHGMFADGDAAASAGDVCAALGDEERSRGRC